MSTDSPKKLKGKAALVTGGSRGIGAAIAKRLAADGAAVALTYSASPAKANEVVRAIEAAGGRALAIGADAADPEAVRRAVARTVDTFGGIDILVNNAGFTKGLARDLGPRGITVNNVQPGPVDTDLNPATGEFAKVATPYVALGRYARTEEIADFVAYLAGPEASYITGASLLADGGYSA